MLLPAPGMRTTPPGPRGGPQARPASPRSSMPLLHVRPHRARAVDRERAAFCLLPPLEQRPDQIAERPLDTVSVTAVPTGNVAEPLLPVADADARRARRHPLAAAPAGGHAQRRRRRRRRRRRDREVRRRPRIPAVARGDGGAGGGGHGRGRHREAGRRAPAGTSTVAARRRRRGRCSTASPARPPPVAGPESVTVPWVAGAAGNGLAGSRRRSAARRPASPAGRDRERAPSASRRCTWP